MSEHAYQIIGTIEALNKTSVVIFVTEIVRKSTGETYEPDEEIVFARNLFDADDLGEVGDDVDATVTSRLLAKYF